MINFIFSFGALMLGASRISSHPLHHGREILSLEAMPQPSLCLIPQRIDSIHERLEFGVHQARLQAHDYVGFRASSKRPKTLSYEPMSAHRDCRRGSNGVRKRVPRENVMKWA